MKAEKAKRGSQLFDYLLQKYNLKNDAALAREVGLAPPVISKVRSGDLIVSPATILAIHEKLGVDVAEIRKVMAA